MSMAKTQTEAVEKPQATVHHRSFGAFSGRVWFLGFETVLAPSPTGYIFSTDKLGKGGGTVRKLVLLALVGLGAQLVDGSLGMAYGVTSTTLLLAIGTNPAAASATVHLAEIGTTLVSGASHWRFGNVDWKVVAKIGIPGAVGAFAGATFLSSLSTEAAAPLMSIILLALGLYILTRFTVSGLRANVWPSTKSSI